MRRAAAGCVLGLAAAASGAAAQPVDLRWYYLHAAAGVEATPLTDGGVFDFQRLRLMTAPPVGPLAFDMAYEHALELRTTRLALGRGFEGAEAAEPWLALQGRLAEGRHARWRHGLDRLSVATSLGGMRLTAGRQAISWATTLFFTPADPFAPFDPADPFREFRGGVDAARAQLFLGPLSQLDAVVRPASTAAGTTVTAVARLSGVRAGWELSGWAGVLHDRGAAALGVAGSVGAFALRGEASLRREGGATVTRAVAGVDRRVTAFARDLFLVAEYQREGFGARGADQLLEVAGSAPFRRGELQVLSRDALALSASWQAHPLVAPDLLALVSVVDGSVLLAPGLSYSLSDEATLRLGAFAGLGRGAAADPPVLRSEHGATPFVGYAAASVFF